MAQKNEVTLSTRHPRWKEIPGDQRSHPCQAPGCLEPTREKKPYCTKHILQAPYVQELLLSIAEKEKEICKAKNRGWRAVDLEGTIATDARVILQTKGECTIDRLSRELNIGLKETWAYVTALVNAGMASVTRHTRRGNAVVSRLG